MQIINPKVQIICILFFLNMQIRLSIGRNAFSFPTAINGHKGLQKGGFALNTLISSASLAQNDRYPTDNPVVMNNVEVRV